MPTYICEGKTCGRVITGRTYHCDKCNKLYCLVCFENHDPCGRTRVYATGVVRQDGVWTHERRR